MSAGPNPNADSPCLEIEFENYNKPVVFPDDAQIEDYCHWIEKRNRDSVHFRHSTTTISSPPPVCPTTNGVRAAAVAVQCHVT